MSRKKGPLYPPIPKPMREQLSKAVLYWTLKSVRAEFRRRGIKVSLSTISRWAKDGPYPSPRHYPAIRLATTALLEKSQ